MRIPLVYIAGPFRAPTAWGIAENIRAAEQIGLEVARLGAMPVIPHANTAHFHGECSDNFWLAGTMELMRRCDAVVMIPGWRDSKGSVAEFEEAMRLGLLVVQFDNLRDSMDHFEEWIKEWKPKA